MVGPAGKGGRWSVALRRCGRITSTCSRSERSRNEEQYYTGNEARGELGWGGGAIMKTRKLFFILSAPTMLASYSHSLC